MPIAILRDKKGFERKMAVPHPMPPYLEVAQCDSYPEVIAELDGDTPAPASYTKVRFARDYPKPEEDAWVYNEVPEALSVTGKALAAAETWKKRVDMMEKLAHAHQVTHGYDQKVVDLMVDIGKSNPSKPEESPTEYLNRLLYLARLKEKAMNWDWETYSSNSTNMDDYYKYKKQQQQQLQYQNQQYQYGQYGNWDPYASISTQQAIPSISPLIPAIVSPPAVEVAPEKPKAVVPDPIEPKKRLMKKEDK